jgi:hypothetical protein
MFDLVNAHKKTIIHQIELFLNGSIKYFEIVIILNSILPFMLSESMGTLCKDLLDILSYYNLDKNEAEKMPNSYLTEDKLRQELIKFLNKFR